MLTNLIEVSIKRPLPPKPKTPPSHANSLVSAIILKLQKYKDLACEGRNGDVIGIKLSTNSSPVSIFYKKIPLSKRVSGSTKASGYLFRFDGLINVNI